MYNITSVSSIAFYYEAFLSLSSTVEDPHRKGLKIKIFSPLFLSTQCNVQKYFDRAYLKFEAQCSR